ncbi:MAG: hypothetical protein ABUT20_62085, partial [Bacteroidota bacterium]
MKFLLPLLTVMLILLCANSFSQDSAGRAIVAIPSKYFDKVSKKADNLNDKLDRKTEKILSQLEKRQEKLRKKLYKIDSLAAKNIFTEADARIKSLEQKLQNPQGLTQYIPFLDTLKTSLQFLDKNKKLLADAKDMQGKLDGAMDKVKGLEDQFQKAEQVKQFLKEQKQYLKDQLLKYGSRLGGQVAKQLTKLNKDVYYYGRQISEYKETIKDPEKIERKAIDLLSHTQIFQDFIKKNSVLASLFRMPVDDPNDPAYLQSLAGLQTRSQVNSIIQNQFGSAGSGALQQAQANMGQAQSALQQLKDKAGSYGNKATDDDMPDFKPNNQKTKTFLQRLEYGTNIQSQKTNSLFPVTSDLGLTVVYRLNDKSVIGIGGSFKIGWGHDIQHIKLSGEGASLRSFLD